MRWLLTFIRLAFLVGRIGMGQNIELCGDPVTNEIRCSGDGGDTSLNNIHFCILLRLFCAKLAECLFEHSLSSFLPKHIGLVVYLK